MENDLISRSALVKTLEKIRTALDQRDEGLAAKIMQIHIQFIECIPTVEAVEVVRCKDCKHKKHLQGARDEAIVCGLGWGLSGIVAEEDFCSYGKRKQGDVGG
jgi:hypothetical protein